MTRSKIHQDQLIKWPGSTRNCTGINVNGPAPTNLRRDGREILRSQKPQDQLVEMYLPQIYRDQLIKLATSLKYTKDQPLKGAGKLRRNTAGSSWSGPRLQKATPGSTRKWPDSTENCAAH
ncbi:hypothetical protein DPEC_G00000170 [Dallia pectoralis]|uniref:Uncharacterized protein n=1 Tax=Dallia pectoralis TaxID=75939 RepID=A0ACC2HJJ4_DALPE|nr:hypothetical protein DPEC_G00000170 [Dallia pectoralis]